MPKSEDRKKAETRNEHSDMVAKKLA